MYTLGHKKNIVCELNYKFGDNTLIARVDLTDVIKNKRFLKTIITKKYMGKTEEAMRLFLHIIKNNFDFSFNYYDEDLMGRLKSMISRGLFDDYVQTTIDQFVITVLEKINVNAKSIKKNFKLIVVDNTEVNDDMSFVKNEIDALVKYS